MDRIGDWICTSTGRQFWPFDPRPEDFDIEDIAHALSNLCRFGGHCREFYSVAEHSVRVSRAIEEAGTRGAPLSKQAGGLWALQGLLHDAGEAYLVDLPRPIKRGPGMETYRSMEKLLEERILVRFLLEWDLIDLGMPAADFGRSGKALVAHFDDVLLATEKRDLMPAQSAAWAPLPDPLEERINPLSPRDASAAFLDRYHEITRNLIPVRRTS